MTANMSRAGRKEQVIELFQKLSQEGENLWLGHRAIAMWLGLKPSPHLLGLLKEMAEEGVLMSELTRNRRGIPKYIFGLDFSYRKLENRKPITIKSRGKIVGEVK